MTDNFKPNIAQKTALIPAKSKINIWGRGTGKSDQIGRDIKNTVENLPRAKGMLYGSTYMQMLSQTLPSTIEGLSRCGLYEDVHYVIGKKPPKGLDFETPFQPPVKYDHTISFYTGTCIQMVSEDSASSGIGLNIDFIYGDEALKFDHVKFGKKASATNRGNRREFQGNPYYHQINLYSSMPYQGMATWLLDFGKYYLEDDYDVFSIINEITDLQIKFVDAPTKAERLTIYAEILKLKKKVTFYPSKDKSKTLYTEFNAFDNIQNLGVDYLENQRRVLSDFEFKTEILNKRPSKIENGFYPLLTEKDHGYRFSYNTGQLESLGYDYRKLEKDGLYQYDADVIKNLPLRLSVDWGSKVSCLPVTQFDTKVLRFIKDFYAKQPQLLHKLAELFCIYYQPHPNRDLIFIEDIGYGNYKRPDDTRTYNEQFAEQLDKYGWHVKTVNLGNSPGSHARYLLWHRYLSGKENLPRIQFNLNNAKHVFFSMSQAPAKEGAKGIEKDKSSERSDSVDPLEATHFSDAADLQLLAIDYDIQQGGGSQDDSMLVVGV